MLDFRNTNTLWASILVETLQRLGLTIAISSPGSRSTPLTVAFTANRRVETIPFLDERSAAFFALGIAKKSSFPVAIICTSGTAIANFYPAIIEARESRVPLIILTADRPPELRDCHSGQTIDQVKFYGNYPNWQTELALPSLDIKMLGYLRQTAIHAWERALFPTPGPVHLNIPFRDPLAPLPEPTAELLKTQFQPEDFFTGVRPILLGEASTLPKNTIKTWQQCEKGIIIAGSSSPKFAQEYCRAISQLSQLLAWPVLAEGLSPLRNYAHLNPRLIATYDLILRNPKLSQQLTPKIALQIGDLPTSKELRNWLDHTQPQRWIVDPSHHNFDPLHGRTIHLRTSIESLVSSLFQDRQKEEFASSFSEVKPDTHPPTNVSPSYLQLWQTTEAKVRQMIDQTMGKINPLLEPKAAWLLSQVLPPETPLFIANSMPVRDVEFFWVPNQSAVQPFFNRGANGIDGTLSTALGIAYRHQASVMLTGDLALLHDTNGFLMRNKFVGHLTIILINNNGGGIFEMLPISQFDPPFEDFFATPQDINFAQLCATYSIEHENIDSWEQFKQRLNPLPSTGIRVLELRTNRHADAKWRQENLGKFAQF